MQLHPANLVVSMYTFVALYKLHSIIWECSFMSRVLFCSSLCNAATDSVMLINISSSRYSVLHAELANCVPE